MMGIFSKRVNNTGATAGMVAGLLCTLLYIFTYKGWFFIPGTNMLANTTANHMLGIAPRRSVRSVRRSTSPWPTRCRTPRRNRRSTSRISSRASVFPGVPAPLSTTDRPGDSMVAEPDAFLEFASRRHPLDLLPPDVRAELADAVDQVDAAADEIDLRDRRVAPRGSISSLPAR